MKSRQFIQSLEKGLMVLKAFSATSPELSVSDLAEACGMSMATVHRYLFTLKELGYLAQDAQSRRYRLTPKILSIGFSLLGTMDIKNRLLPHMLETTKAHDVTTQCAILDETDIVILDRVRSKEVVNLGHRRRLPPAGLLHRHGQGHSGLPEKDDQTRVLDKIRFDRHTEYTLGSQRELKANLVCIRQNGYVLSDQELTVGLRSIAAPVLRNGRVEGAFGISYAVNRANEEGLETALVEQVLEIAAKVSF